MSYLYKEEFPAVQLIERILADNPDVEDTHGNVARLIGVNWHTVQAWRLRDTKFRPFMADRYAIMAGYHPFEVWGELWWQQAAVKPIKT